MWQDEFVSALDNFKRDMIDLHAKRTCDMISDISKVLADSNTAVGISEAVSNPPSTEGATEAVSKPSSIEGVAEAIDFMDQARKLQAVLCQAAQLLMIIFLLPALISQI